MDGNTARGASSPAKPALHMPEPLSMTRAAISSSIAIYSKMQPSQARPGAQEQPLHKCPRREAFRLPPTTSRPGNRVTVWNRDWLLCNAPSSVVPRRHGRVLSVLRSGPGPALALPPPPAAPPLSPPWTRWGASHLTHSTPPGYPLFPASARPGLWGQERKAGLRRGAGARIPGQATQAWSLTGGGGGRRTRKNEQKSDEKTRSASRLRRVRSTTASPARI